MSFRCEDCGQAQPPRTKLTLLVVEFRERIYPMRKKHDIVIDKGGRGYETVKEIKICGNCLSKRLDKYCAHKT